MQEAIGFDTQVRRTRIHEQIITILLKKIIQGEIAPGDKLPTERAMAEDFSVNRATVREAVRYLEHLELLEIRQGDGTYARSYLESSNLELLKVLAQTDEHLNPDILSSLLELRRLTIPEMAYHAALKRTDGHVARLEEIVRSSPGLPIMERDKMIYHVMAQASRNIVYVLMTNFYEEFFDYFGYLYFEKEPNIARSQRFHEEILAAVTRQNAGQARSIVKDVLLYAEQAVFAEMKNRGILVR